eukprot:m.257613 g.257613  ORF g.257613 m.257613 type:complete len:71 (+) comp16191_c1_seq1:288-500(+)
MQKWTILLFLLQVHSCTSLTTVSIVKDGINWPEFLSRHDMLFSWKWDENQQRFDDYLPVSWLTSPWTGNG